jgi:hypothetical protein
MNAPLTSPRRTRDLLRVLHLVVGGLLAAYVYLPADLPVVEVWRWSLMLVGVPAVTATGLLMWKQAAARRLLARLGTRPSVAATTTTAQER